LAYRERMFALLRLDTDYFAAMYSYTIRSITFGPVTLRTSDHSDQCPFGPVTCNRHYRYDKRSDKNKTDRSDKCGDITYYAAEYDFNVEKRDAGEAPFRIDDDFELLS